MLLCEICVQGKTLTKETANLRSGGTKQSILLGSLADLRKHVHMNVR